MYLKNSFYYLLTTLIFLCLPYLSIAQEEDSLLASLVNESLADQTDEDAPVLESYKSTRIINSASNEMVGNNEFDFVIDHHFGDIAGQFGGVSTFWGMDNAADIRIGFIFGISDKVNLGIGRYKGTYYARQNLELNLKAALMQQTEKSHPISITYYGTYMASLVDLKAGSSFYENFGQRLNTTQQLIFTRKFSDKFTLSLIPTYIYNGRQLNRVGVSSFAMGIGGRYKISKRMALLADYFYNTNPEDVYAFLGTDSYNPLAVGLEIETGGHVFHICFMNNPALSESQFITENYSTWTNGGFRWGFRISRVFNL